MKKRFTEEQIIKVITRLLHRHGTTLQSEEKSDLMEFLKTLQPEPEFSWETPAPYRWNGSSCE